MNLISLKCLFVGILLFCFQSAHGKCARLNKRDEFIVGGKPALTPIPYQVSYQVLYAGLWEHVCGGTIISLHHVLTAAHCIEEEASQITVLAGTVSLNSGGARYKVAWTKKHPKHVYHVQYVYDDIGILRIEGKFVLSKDVQPIAFNCKKLYPGGELVWVSGWGCTDQNATVFPDTLQYVAQRTMSNKNCIRIMKNIGDRHICAFGGFGRGCCGGDSGGPLVNFDKNVLIGIMSYVRGVVNHCADGFPDVYTRVSTYVDWIENTIHENCV